MLLPMESLLLEGIRRWRTTSPGFQVSRPKSRFQGFHRAFPDDRDAPLARGGDAALVQLKEVQSRPPVFQPPASMWCRPPLHFQLHQFAAYGADAFHGREPVAPPSRGGRR